MSWQCTLSALKANYILEHIKRITNRLMEAILLLYFTLFRLHLQYCIQLWGPQSKKAMDLLEQNQSPQEQAQGWSTSLTNEGWESWGCLGYKREGFRRPHSGLPVLKGFLHNSWKRSLYQWEILHSEEGKALEQVALRNCGCLNPECVQGHIGWDFGLHSLETGVPAHSRRVETR